MTVLGGNKSDLTVERLRQRLVEIAVLTGDDGAIGQRNADRRPLRTTTQWLAQGGPECEEMRPFSGVFGGCDFAIGTVQQGVYTIAQQPVVSYLGGMQLFSHHGLDGVPPQRNHRAHLSLRCACHLSTSCTYCI